MDDSIKIDALTALDQVTEAVRQALSDSNLADNINLGSGLAGSLVFLSTLYKKKPCASFALESRKILQAIFTKVATDEFSEVGLYSGLAGIAWAVNYAISAFGASTLGISDSATEEIDHLLISMFKHRWRGHYDLISGIVGIGVYSLGLKKTDVGIELFRSVTKNLQEMAEGSGTGMTWHTSVSFVPVREQPNNQNGWYNLGLAHGVPGVIALLGRACVLGYATDKDRAVLASAVKWLLHQSLSENELTFGFSTSLAQKRTAWCYGDLGIAVALLHAAAALESENLKSSALNLASRSLSISHSKSGAVDASICHGSLGVSHIARRIFDSSNDPRFYDQHIRWLNFALYENGSNSLDRFSCYEGSGRIRLLNTGYLNGLSGVGLALIDAIYEPKCSWNVPLLTDFTGKIWLD